MVDQGVGCWEVLILTTLDYGRGATLRISSQHIANWLHHGICNESKFLK